MQLEKSIELLNNAEFEAQRRDDKLFAREIEKARNKYQKDYNFMMEETEGNNPEVLRQLNAARIIAERHSDDRIERENPGFMRGVEKINKITPPLDMRLVQKMAMESEKK